MNIRVLHFLMTVVFVVLGCTLLGYGTNWQVGTGTFFIIWGAGGLLEVLSNKVQ
jgi:hypothetical protein